MDIKPLSFEKTKILVVGDIMLDRYISGKVRRISPEAPVPIVKVQRTSETLGGAGNVAFNLVSLGCGVTVVGMCGNDSEGVALRNLLAAKGIEDCLTVDDSRPTITKTRIISQKQQMLRMDVEDITPPAAGVASDIRASVLERLRTSDAVILSDYGKGFLADSAFVQEIIHTGRKIGIPILVDPKGTDWERYRGASGITPNTMELEAVVGSPLEEAESRLIASAKEIRFRFNLDWLLVTRGPLGMCLIDSQDEAVLVPAQAREVFDVSGAGDTVIATLSASMAAGLPLVEAARAANLAGGIVVGKSGTQPILYSELVTALTLNSRQQYHPHSAAKIAALDAALARIGEWRSGGAKIVFTNGCFDLLHPGHVSLLHQARAAGDRLVVGLNTDASIKRLKGEGRPILSEQDRAAILSALASVDLVVLFSEDTPLRLIEAIRPDVLVKGSDYTPDRVVGRDVVESYGGCVYLVDLIKGYSTTGLTRKVMEEYGNNSPQRPA